MKIQPLVMLLYFWVTTFICSVSAFADVEPWFNKDGNKAELDLLLVSEGKTGREGDFLTKSGKIITLGESDLSPEGAAKLRSLPITRVYYSHNAEGGLPSNDILPSIPGALFTFIAEGPTLLGFRASEVFVRNFSVDPATNWTQRRRRDYESSTYKKSSEELSASTKLLLDLAFDGNYDEKVLKEANLEGDVTLLVGAQLTTISHKIRLRPESDEEGAQFVATLGPFEVKMDEYYDDTTEPDRPFLVSINDNAVDFPEKDTHLGMKFKAAPMGSKPFSQLINVDFLENGKPVEKTNRMGGFKIRIEREVTISISYWSKIHEKKLPFAKVSGAYRIEEY